MTTRSGQHQYPVNATAPESELRIQFTASERHRYTAKVACLEDVTHGKLRAYSDPCRRPSKRKKDELDLIRLAEVYPELKSLYPAELRDQIDRGSD